MKGKKTLKPFDKLEKRLIKEFDKKKLLGDIYLNSEEERLLYNYFKMKYVDIKRRNHIICDRIFTIALVRIGVKSYDGSFWPHVAEILSLESLPANQQTWLGKSATCTLIKYDKLTLSPNEHVSNILMHGFVSNHYINSLYDFLFKFYKIDLDRDIDRLDTDTMKSLCKIMTKKDNTDRTGMLRSQIADCVDKHYKGATTRIRSLLKLIDNCFWDNDYKLNSKNRFSNNMQCWKENSTDFKEEKQRYIRGGYSKGKKQFTMPFIKCDLNSNTFKLKLPSQLIKTDILENLDLQWVIESNSIKKVLDVMVVSAITGVKTENESINLTIDDIFSGFKINLMLNGNKYRSFALAQEDIRFFDTDGNYTKTTNISKGDYFSFAHTDYIPVGEAVLETDNVNGLHRSAYQFQNGDILRLPNNKTLVIGYKLHEGLGKRALIENAFISYQDQKLDIYSDIPYVFIKLLKSRTNGTMIKVNGKKHRLFDDESIEVNNPYNLDDKDDMVGYKIKLENFDIDKNGIYEVIIDVPNDNSKRSWCFAYVKNFDFKFEDAPYVFKNKGTISFENNIKLECDNVLVKKTSTENIFDFEISPEIETIKFYTNDKLEINVYVPMLIWKFDDENWQTNRPVESIWHTDFPKQIYIKYPGDKISLSLDEILENDDDTEQKIDIDKNKQLNLFICDMTKFFSWFSTDYGVRTLYFEDGKRKNCFNQIITRSKILSSYIMGDFRNDRIIGEFNIIGKSNYFVDISKEGQEIVSKLPLLDGKFEYNIKNLSGGNYDISVFEDNYEDDEFGFGEVLYSPIKTIKKELILPYNLQGKIIEVKNVLEFVDNGAILPFKCQYNIYLKKLIKETDNKYSGKMVAYNDLGIEKRSFQVFVEFFDLNKLNYCKINVLDDGEEVEFLYDSTNEFLVKEEDPKLTKSAAYRRYEFLYEDDYIYEVEFI